MTSTPRFRQAVAHFVTIFGLIFLVGCSSSEERAENHYKRGLELVEEGELTKASLEFRNALKLKSDHVDALFAFGGVQERQGDHQAAYRVYTAVTEQDANHAPARVKLVYMLLTANQIERASSLLKQAEAVDADDLDVVLARATFELRTGNPGTAEKNAQKALAANPNSSDAFILLASSRMAANDPDGALEYLNQAPASTDENVGLQLLRMRVLEVLNDDAGIEVLFEELVESFPDTPQFSYAWARWYLAKGRNDDAERVMRDYALEHSEDTEAQLALVSFVVSRHGQDAGKTELETIIKSREEQEVDSFELKMALGELLYASGHQSEAIELAQSVVANTNDNQNQNRARLLLASMLGQQDRMDQAEKLINEVLDNDSKNVEALRLRATIKISRNDSAGAADDIVLALNEAPESPQLRAMLANAYERNGSTALAEEQYSRALALSNGSPEVGLPMVQFLLRHGKAERATQLLERLRESAPSNQSVLTLLAQQKLASQDFVGAQEISETLRQIENGGSETADKISAAALGGLNRHEESIALLKNSKANPEVDNVLLPDLIGAYVRAGRQDDAVAHLLSILEKTPDDTTANVLLGNVYLSQNKFDEAEAKFRSAAADSQSVLGDTALAQYYLGTRKFGDAEQVIRSGLEKDGDSASLRLMLTTVLQQTERFDEAIDEYELMFAANPDSTILANDLASLLSERRGDEASLERAFEIAIRFRSSEVPQYLDTLGWIYYLRGEYSSALPLLRNASQNLPNMGLAQYHYGMALSALNQKEKAIAALESAVALKTYMTEEDLQNARATISGLQDEDAAKGLN